MRTKDIKAGQEYAMQDREWSQADRVRVVEFDVDRKAYSGSRDYRGHTVHNGILVEVLNPKTGETRMKPVSQTWDRETGNMVYSDETEPVTRVTISRFITRTWDEQVAIHAAQYEREEAKARREADYRSRRSYALNRIEEIFGQELDYGDSRQYGVTEVKLGINDVERIVEWMEDAIASQHG